ncbi:MAG: hypothetical protein M1827_001907 [Pycnora praestabilis]|nr:MAG: hypothetical protein M1827_001907 [Pycnora praestabilis]
MRRVKIFAGSSHPVLAESVCERLGTQAAKCELKKFSNGETSVSIGTSIRDQDVFIVQSGSSKTNDALMELLIMINACKGGSAKSITAVMPYFPYSRQSKKKSHRGAITARMVANLLTVAGIDHIITIDLHVSPLVSPLLPVTISDFLNQASQMQGFFGKPVDNLYAEPLIARWIRNNIPNWREAVVVSKNPGGTKRVTSLADALKLNFGIVTTDRKRPNMNGSMILENVGTSGASEEDDPAEAELDAERMIDPLEMVENSPPHRRRSFPKRGIHSGHFNSGPATKPYNALGSHPLARSTRVDSISNSPPTSSPTSPSRRCTVVATSNATPGDDTADEYTDEKARDVITGRLVQGHIVDDDYPSPTMSAMSTSIATLPDRTSILYDDAPSDPMTSSFMSTTSAQQDALGGSCDARASSDEEEEGYVNPIMEQTVTLVGNVKNKTVFIMDDIIDKCGSWIAAAETVVKRGGAKKVYCIATHGLFGNDCLEEMEACDCIDYIVVTNSFPIPPEKAKTAKKLVTLELSGLLSEAIRRNHYGESISQLFQHYND